MNQLDGGDEPSQSDFCSLEVLDLCDDIGFLTSSEYTDDQAVGDSEPSRSHLRELRDLELEESSRSGGGGLKNAGLMRSQDLKYSSDLTAGAYSFSPNGLPSSPDDLVLYGQSANQSSSVSLNARESVSSFYSMSSENSEERSRARSSPVRPAGEIEYHRSKHEIDFTRIASSRDPNVHSHTSASVPDHISDYGGSERSYTRSRVSAHEDLCNFYADQGSQVNFSAVSLADVDHPLDIAWLSDRCDGDVHLLVAVLETFCQQGGSHCTEIGYAVQRGDFDNLCFHTDFLVGSARNVGARDLEQHAEDLASLLRHRSEQFDLAEEAASRAEDVIRSFDQVASFWKAGVQAVQGGRVHPLEERPEVETGGTWPRSMPSSFKLTMAQLRDYLRAAGIEGAGLGDESGAAFGGEACVNEEGDDEATEPSERGGWRWGGGLEASSSVGSIGSPDPGSRADSDDMPDEPSECDDMATVFRKVVDD